MKGGGTVTVEKSRKEKEGTAGKLQIWEEESKRFKGIHGWFPWTGLP